MVKGQVHGSTPKRKSNLKFEPKNWNMSHFEIAWSLATIHLCMLELCFHKWFTRQNQGTPSSWAEAILDLKRLRLDGWQLPLSYWWVLSHPWTPKEKRQHGKGLGLDPPVAIVPTIAAPELQLSESPHILKRYDTPPAEHGSARLRRRLEGLTFELGWDFARQFSQRGKLHLFCRFFVFFPLKLAKLVSIWDSNTQRAQKGKT